MKSCPKCNRTFPDEGQKFCTFDGGLLIAPQAFDPNATIRATAVDLTLPSEKATSRELPPRDFNETIAASFAPTTTLPRNTGPTTTGPTTSELAGKAPAEASPPSVQATPPSVNQQVPGLDQTIAIQPDQTEIQTTPPVASVPTSQALPSTQPPPPVQTQPQPQSAPPAQSARLVQTAVPAQAAAAVARTEKKKSKVPLIIILVVLLLLLGGGALIGIAVVFKPQLEQLLGRNQPQPTPVVEVNANSNTSAATPEVSPVAANTNTDNFTPPANSELFVNSKDNLDGKLAEHYFDFYFYYPKDWKKDPKAGVPGASNFVLVERSQNNFPLENFAVGWYTSTGTFAGDSENYPKRVEEFSNALSKQFPEYHKVSEGPTKINSMQGYEFRWEGLSKGSERGDVYLWGRVVFLPTGNDGDTTGATLTMFSTSVAPELKSVNDVGEAGEMPVILESFRFGKR